MTPDPTLTDEELAEMSLVYAESEDWRWVHGHAGLQRPLIRRLLTALRASRAEVERLREDARENYARAERAEQALVAARAALPHLP